MNFLYSILNTKMEVSLRNGIPLWGHIYIVIPSYINIESRPLEDQWQVIVLCHDGNIRLHPAAGRSMKDEEGKPRPVLPYPCYGDRCSIHRCSAAPVTL